MTKREEFEAAAAQQILIKDGPYGTAIQRAGLRHLTSGHRSHASRRQRPREPDQRR